MKAWIAWCLLLISTASFGSAAANDSMQLRVGQSELIEVPGIERVALANGDIAEVEVIEASDEILLIARNPGLTDLRIWSTDRATQRVSIRVSAVQETSQRPQVSHLVERIEGVNLERINGSLLLTGQAQSARDQTRLAALTQNYPSLKDFTDKPTPPPTPTVRLQARFVELRQSTLRQIGVNWSTQSPGITFAYASDFYTNDVFRGSLGPALPADQLPLDIGEANQYLGLGLNLSSMIDLLDESGDARVIAEPMLSTLSGSSAEFQAGGEVPIPIQGPDGNTTVTFKDYGILLKVAPNVLDAEHIRTRVEVEVSAVDESVSVLGVPGFSVRNAVTEMRGKSGRTLLIAGLIDEQQSEAVSRLPGLGNLPVIGELFRSRRFQNDQTELVVLITPYTGSHVIDAPQSIGTGTDPSAALPNTLPTASDSPLPLERTIQ